MPEIPEIGSGQIRNIGITINEIGVNSIPVFDPSKVGMTVRFICTHTKTFLLFK